MNASMLSAQLGRADITESCIFMTMVYISSASLLIDVVLSPKTKA